MKTKLYGNIKLLSVLILLFSVTACATVKPEEAVNQKAGELTQEANSKATSESGELIRTSTSRTEAVRPDVQNSSATQVSTATTSSQQNITARIVKNEKRVKIKSAASNKSRTIARLRGGKHIEILEGKGSWLKIRWQDKEKFKEGWSRKQYVDMTP